MVFKLGLPDTVTNQDQRLFILDSLPDLRMKAMTKFAESTDIYLAKLRNLFFGHQ